MKIVTKHLMFALLASLLPTVALAEEDPDIVVSQPYYYPGFFGHPFLSQDGWIATHGSFDISAGQSGAYHRDYSKKLEKITNTDPTDTNDEFSLVGLGVAYNEIIRIVVDPAREGEVAPIPIGRRVGFAMRQGGSDVEVVDLDVISMSVINFLDKEDKIIKSVVTKEDEQFNVLNLGVVKLSSGEAVQKVIAKIPEGDPDLRDENGESKVYGFSLSYAGVNVELAKNVQILYGFMDDYEEVPIIKMNYPFATGTGAGMTTGAKQLVDNDLKNGASTAILNIGGAYYNVRVNEFYTHDYTDALGSHKRGDPVIFPKGVEAGWVITGGQALTLDLGQAYKMRGIKVDGSYVDIATSVSVIGANLAGGGTQRLTFMTPTDKDVDLVGFRLENIKGVSLELGATVYNYAYIKLPTYEDFIPKRITPFNAKIEAVPASTTQFKNGSIINSYQNDIRLANDVDRKPLLIPSNYNDDDLASVWDYHNGTGFNGAAQKYYTLQLGLSRITIYSDGTEKEANLGRYDIVRTTDNAWGTNGLGDSIKKNTTYWRYKEKPGSTAYYYNKNTLPDENGVIDLTPLFLADASLSNTITNDNNVIAYLYGLYYLTPEQDAKDIDNYSQECIPLDYSEVTIPDYQPEFELAGSVDYIDINNNTLTTVSPRDEAGSTEVTSEEILSGAVIDTDLYHHYVSFEIPDKTDEKVNIKSVTLYRYKDSNHDALQTYEWDGSNWVEQIKENKGKYMLGYAKVAEQTDEDGNLLEYHHKLVALIDDPDDKYEYGLGYTLQLDPDYQKLLKDTYKAEYTSRKLEYEWYKGSKRDYNIPELKHTESVPTAVGDNVKVTSYWDLTLNSAKSMHNAQLRNEPDDVLNADWLDNVEILYNQWTTLDTKENVNKGLSKMRALDAETEEAPVPEFPVTDLTVNFNSAVNSDDVSYIDSADANTEYLDSKVKEDSQLVSEVTYTKNVVGQDMLYSATARAYVPVVPYGFQSLVTDKGADGSEGLSNTIQTYLVVESSMDKPIELYAVPTGVEDLTADTTEYDEQAEYYTTLGVKVVNPGTGVYIVRRGNTVTKEMIVR